MPKRICFTEADQARTTEYFHHGMAEFVSPGERVLSLLPGSSPGSLNALLRQGLAQMSVTLELFGYPQLEQYPELLRVISERQITALVGPPSVIAAVARFSAEAGPDRAYIFPPQCFAGCGICVRGSTGNYLPYLELSGQ